MKRTKKKQGVRIKLRWLDLNAAEIAKKMLREALSIAEFEKNDPHSTRIRFHIGHSKFDGGVLFSMGVLGSLVSPWDEQNHIECHVGYDESEAAKPEGMDCDADHVVAKFSCVFLIAHMQTKENDGHVRHG